MRFNSLIDALQEALRQQLLLLTELSEEAYCAPAQGHLSSSVGKHIRHNLDHFESFFHGLDACQIDYENRSRQGQIESISEVAIAVLEDLIVQLQALRTEDERELAVREESAAGANQRRWLKSSLGRELQFLLGHTVHHNALIAMIVDRHGLALPEGFGIAPSTLRHQQVPHTPENICAH
ncbi:DinB family protein [Coraliomargarita algicola]|uniref:DinB family protein n=1 Tax=Coraliomargarita algicola TaxID=3092156 RepID=A0ABZ0RMA1_9BACT|nr:DinB family protein [Coraliomargarita sp. J2-16]WPJ96369.1 DinB family protein [Coraliomargarita sp. J2-16]